jgi:tRNA modification GTPase
MSTIFARCSGSGKAGVVVYRISGPSSILGLEKLIGCSTGKMRPRTMYFRKIFNPKTGVQIDEAMVVYFNANSSFTGEESVEIHAHGSIAVMKLLNQALLSMDDLRLAEAGEFTKRAFLNGKFDLTAAEGLADLIDAETESQHKQAIRQLGGGLEAIYTNWRGQLLKTMSLIEAYIDFPDEDIPLEVFVNIKVK